MDDPEQMSSGVSAAVPEKSSIGVFSVVRILSAAAIAILFSLYAIGFVIMNSFLSRFGVKAGAIFTFDYVAAALCYLIFLAAVAVPLWIIFFGFFQWQHGTKGSLKAWILPTVVIWCGLLYVFRQLYFSEDKLPRGWSLTTTVMTLMLVPYVVTIAILRSRVKQGKVWRVLTNELLLPGYLTISGFVTLIGLPSVDGAFVFSAVLLFTSGTALMGTGLMVWDLKENLKRRDVQALLAVLWACVLLVNASEFGRKQYAALPASVGGGHPATVMVKSALATAANGQQFQLPVDDGVIGPVLLLYQTSTDVCVITKDSFDKGAGGAVQLRRELVEWIATAATKAGNSATTGSAGFLATPSSAPPSTRRCPHVDL